MRAEEPGPPATLRSPRTPGAPAHWMDLIHSSFSSCVGAEIRYTMWFPSTTRPSASVLQALMSCPLLLGMYSSKQFWGDKGEEGPLGSASPGARGALHRQQDRVQGGSYWFPGVVHLADAQILQRDDSSGLLVLRE